MKRFLDVVDRVPCLGTIYGLATDKSQEKFPQVWRSERKPRKIDSLFLVLALGANYILSEDIDRARQCAASANYFSGISEQSFNPLEVVKTTELFVGDQHTLVRYLQERIPCSCLDEKYEEVKDIKKIGLCCNTQCKIPDRMTERSSMVYCSRCRSVSYCSRECQEAHWHWPRHKELCEMMRRERKESKTNPPAYDLMKSKE